AFDESDLFALVRGAWPYRDLARADFDAVIGMASEGFATRRGRRAALVHRDEVNGRVRGRRGSRSLAITSGGAIPEVADYRVVLDPDETFIGTLNEDFAIESTAGDIVQLGNASWLILQVGSGVVRVADARGAPPTLPFWLGEAPGRSDELSRAVSDLRATVARLLAQPAPGPPPTPLQTPSCSAPGSEPAEAPTGLAAAIDWLMAESGVSAPAADQAIAYLAEGLRALGVLPTQDTLVLERFFDESGGMQLVLHAPFGSRVNKAWGLALRKRFCRQFNFELQAAATDDALLLSLGPQHSFPLADVFRYLHPATARAILVQAFLDAPVFQTRWRWNTTISLAVPRNRHGKKTPPPIQRMMADDLMAAAFPDAAACIENIEGDREIPDHPLVAQTVHDCLQEAMDFDALAGVLTRIHRGEITCVARDTPEPSVLAHEILNARPYAFLDDAPLEERRTQAVYTRRAGEAGADGLGVLDEAAIARVKDEVRPDPRDADELHDALLTAGLLTDEEVAEPSMIRQLVEARRAVRASIDGGGGRSWWIAAERLPELTAVHPAISIDAAVTIPASRAGRHWTREGALVELVRSRLTITGPITTAELAASLGVDEAEVEPALLELEGEGVVLRGMFSATARAQGTGPLLPVAREWCDRRLLARIHRYTLNRLRAEIAPVSPADCMRFLFDWQHVAADARLHGPDGVLEVIRRLDGFELAAGAWEASVISARLDRYDSSMLDLLCLSGRVAWARVSRTSSQTRMVRATPVALFVREHTEAWLTIAAAAVADADAGQAASGPLLSTGARAVLDALVRRGASFVHDLVAACGLPEESVRQALGELASGGL
ncbi:MAG: Lhr family ATP-dependent helicase, partial [Acidobacteriota bacterium]